MTDLPQLIALAVCFGVPLAHLALLAAREFFGGMFDFAGAF